MGERGSGGARPRRPRLRARGRRRQPARGALRERPDLHPARRRARARLPLLGRGRLERGARARRARSRRKRRRRRRGGPAAVPRGPRTERRRLPLPDLRGRGPEQAGATRARLRVVPDAGPRRDRSGRHARLRGARPDAGGDGRGSDQRRPRPRARDEGPALLGRAERADRGGIRLRARALPSRMVGGLLAAAPRRGARAARDADAVRRARGRAPPRRRDGRARPERTGGGRSARRSPPRRAPRRAAGEGLRGDLLGRRGLARHRQADRGGPRRERRPGRRRRQPPLLLEREDARRDRPRPRAHPRSLRGGLAADRGGARRLLVRRGHPSLRLQPTPRRSARSHRPRLAARHRAPRELRVRRLGLARWRARPGRSRGAPRGAALPGRSAAVLLRRRGGGHALQRPRAPRRGADPDERGPPLRRRLRCARGCDPRRDPPARSRRREGDVTGPRRPGCPPRRAR